MNTVTRSANARQSSLLRQRSRMHWLLCASLGALALALGAGCVQLGVPATVKALSQDTNAITVHVSSPWGVLDVVKGPKP